MQAMRVFSGQGWRFGVAACVALLALTGCKDAPQKKAPGERLDVLTTPGHLKADAAVAEVPIDVPEQVNLTEWRSTNEAMATPQPGLLGVSHEASVHVGEGNAFSRAVVSPPIVVGGVVYAMDAAGAVSAHDESHIEKQLWVDDSGRPRGERDALGGGLAYAENTVFATSGFGMLRALDAATGKPRWQISVGAPVRGAPAAGNGLVVVLTADNQTLAYDATNGTPRWEHRGIRESAGYFATTAPVISDGIVIAAYSSGEVFALRLDTGSVLWSDTLSAGVRTKAAAAFSGIDADPVVQEGVVVLASASGAMQASALANGRPLWQQHIGAHRTPWSSGNAVFVLTDTNDVAAVLKRDGAVRWATSLAVEKNGKDETPALFGPIVSANAVLVVSADGTLTSLRTANGEVAQTFPLASGIVSPPVIVNGALYVLTKDAVLHRYDGGEGEK